MTDQYAVIGNPIGHSRSPEIHAAFARQVGHKLSYVAIEAPVGEFAEVAEQFRRKGGCGLNVTAPFKLDAFAYASEFSRRAKVAGAANTLCFHRGDGSAPVHADNTDGVGLVNDLRRNLACELAGRRILLLGAGGAARGVIGALAESAPKRLAVANRTHTTALKLAQDALVDAGGTSIVAIELGQLEHEQFDIVINATSASLSSQHLPVPANCFAPGSLAYDMTYAKGNTPFLQVARNAGANCADGIGMLVEQAAEAFLVWRGVRPDTRPVIASIKAAL